MTSILHTDAALHPQPGAATAIRPGRTFLFGSTALATLTRLALLGMIGSLGLASDAAAQSLPGGGTISAGAATITAGPGSMTIHQSSDAVAINWDSFNIAAGNTVQFVQPGSNSVALNRVLGADPSSILGSLSANGKVFLVNPNGILFGKGAQVSVGGLVASTLDMTDVDLLAGRYRFSGTSDALVLNEGNITAADGGYVALLGANVSNQGAIAARLGTVALAAGRAVTLDVAGDGLLNVAVDRGAVNALVSNGGLIRADGGSVVLTAQAAGQLLRTAVNNSGVIEARSLEARGGRIVLLADMQSGTLDLSGTLDASAPGGGNGGFVETSAANVRIADPAIVTTAAPLGTTGTWLIDPQDFTVAATGGNMTGAKLSELLVTNSVIISTLPGGEVMTAGAPPVTTIGTSAPGEGNININDAVAWTASSSTTTLTLNAVQDVNINAAITATNGNVVACCGRDVNVNAAVTTTNGSVLLNAGHNVNVFHAMVTTDGNIALCAGHDVHIEAAITLTGGAAIASQSLGLTRGLVIIAGADGTGPGVGGGTLIFGALTPKTTVTAAPVIINYNPVSYAAPTDFSGRFTLTEGAALAQHMLLFPNADKAFDGTTAATLSGFRTDATSGLPNEVTLIAGPGSSAVFDSAAQGAKVGVTYSGYTLAGAKAGQYALAGSCCVSTYRTSGTIAAAAAPAPVPVPVPVPVSPPPPPAPVPVPVPPPPAPVPVPVPPPPSPSPVIPQPVIPPPVIPPVVGPITPPVTPPVVGPITPPVTPPPVTPPVADASAPGPSAATLVSEAGTILRPLVAGPNPLNFAVLGEGVLMPVAELQETIAPLVVEQTKPAAATPAIVRPRIILPPKQDRN